MSVVIKAEHISKKYQLGVSGSGTLKGDLHRWWETRVLRKEDPLSKLEHRNRNDFWALNDIGFEVRHGDAVGIIGKNGAGKSTLLKILSRITLPTTGSIRVRGRIASLLEVGTGFNPDLTGRENVFLNGAILGMTKQEVKRKFDEIVDFAGVEQFIDTPVKRYSSGMYVRLAFAVAAHLEPDILIVDEVLAVGDAEFQSKCIGKMDDASRREGRTVLFVSHAMGTIAQLCNRAILLKKGEIIADGLTDSVINQYIGMSSSKTVGYELDTSELEEKNMYFTKIHSVNDNGEQTSDFGFHESINLVLTVRIVKRVLNVKIGVALLDKVQSRVFTVHEDVEALTPSGKTGEHELRLKLPSNLIAPNHYSFIFALFIPNGDLQDYIENQCPVRIHDTGTEFALFEGSNYGSIVVDAKWQ